MRGPKRAGNFFLSLAFNMLLNPEGLILAVILLVLHFVLGLSIWWSVLAFGVWILWLVLWMAFMGWAGRCSRPDPPKENKNPYSVKK